MEPFNNSLLLQWGFKQTDNDGAARITIPIAFSNNQWKCIAMHLGGGAGVCYEDSGYKTITWIPVRVVNISGVTGGGWTIEWIGIGY